MCEVECKLWSKCEKNERNQNKFEPNGIELYGHSVYLINESIQTDLLESIYVTVPTVPLTILPLT
jgi:hypothetical protein